jgi:hypothetical protein
MPRTARDDAILDTLSRRVRVISLEQVVRTWWPGASSAAPAARRRLGELRDAKLLRQVRLNARPLLPLKAPVFAWEPDADDPDPDPDAIAYQLQSRWRKPPRTTTVFVATPKARAQYGAGSRGRVNAATLTHDLHVTELYLRLLLAEPVTASAWVGEDMRPKAGFRLKDPDAVLEFPDGRPPRVVEFAGAYDARHVRDFHEDCRRRRRAYELW